MAEEVAAKAIATAAVKKILGTTDNITYHNYIRECHPSNEYVKWADYEGTVVMHAYKCRRGGATYECFTVVYIEGLTGGEGVTLCYYVPQGLWGRLSRRFLEACPSTAEILVRPSRERSHTPGRDRDIWGRASL